MPRLSKQDPAFKKLPDLLPDSFAYPDIDDIIEDTAGSSSIAAEVSAWVADQSTKNYQGGGEIGLATIATTIGVAADLTVENIANALDDSTVNWLSGSVASVQSVLGNSGSLLSAIADASGGDPTALVREAMKIGIGVSIQLMSQIPVVGWIAEIAWTFGNGIYQLVQAVKTSNASDGPVLYPQSRFNPQRDLNRFNDKVLTPMRYTQDWTEIFRPPGGGVPANAAWLGEFETQALGTTGPNDTKFGDRIQATNPCTDCLGYVPGTAFLHERIEMVGANVKDSGNALLPTARQHGVWIWEHIARKNSPALYTVNAKTLASGWGNYLKALRLYVEGNNKLSAAQKNKLISFYNKDSDGRPIFGWGKPRTTQGGAWIPDEDVAKYQPVKAATTLRERQLAFLDTHTCAYVDDSFGAMSDPTVKNKWKQRRKDLLEHPSICDVDLSMIPDAIYRGQVEFEQDQRPSCKFGGPGKLGAGGGGGQGEGGADAPEVPGGGGGASDGAPISNNGSSSRIARNLAIASGAIAAAGAAAYYLDNDLRRAVSRIRRHR
jgi:hypothetical protein